MTLRCLMQIVRHLVKHYFRTLAGILLSVTFHYSSIACAENFSKTEDSKKHSVTFLSAIGSYESIDLLLKKKRLISPYSYFVGIGYRSPEVILDYVRLNVELMKHFGKQQSFELTLYPSIESPAVYFGNVGFNIGIGDGISTMIGPYPKFEEYRTVKTRRMLNFLVIEQNFFLKDKPEHKITIRWHHRCHCFKTMAPQGAGSNFFGIGFRYSF